MTRSGWRSWPRCSRAERDLDRARTRRASSLDRARAEPRPEASRPGDPAGRARPTARARHLPRPPARRARPVGRDHPRLRHATCGRSRRSAPDIERLGPSPEPALRWLAALSRPPRPCVRHRAPAQGRGRSAPSTASASRRSSSAVDIADGLELPRAGRWRCRRPLDVDEVAALLEATDAGGCRPGSATGRCWSCCTRPGCASARRSGLDVEDLSIEAESVRVIGKGDRERVVPVGDVALAAIERYLERGPDRWLARPRPGKPAGDRRGRPAVPLGARAGGWGGWRRGGPSSARRSVPGLTRACDAAHVAA